MEYKIKQIFSEENISRLFGLLLVLAIVLAIYSFFSNKRSPLITSEAAQTELEISMESPIEPVETYSVKTGDTLSNISKGLYADASMWPLVATENDLKDPNLIYAGQLIKLPSKEQVSAYLGKTKPGQILTGVSIEALTDSTYKIHKGDSLWQICERRYGNPGKYVDIAKLNKISDPDHIEVDWQLSLPDL